MEIMNVQRTMPEERWRMGSLVNPSPLAASFVPFQDDISKKYRQDEALTSGTLFPGLDLPFKNYVAKKSAVTGPSEELMALCFAVHELGLYLDTHPQDSEAFELFKMYSKLYNEYLEKYQQKFGPITMRAAAEGDRFAWIENPWPWELSERKEV